MMKRQCKKVRGGGVPDVPGNERSCPPTGALRQVNNWEGKRFSQDMSDVGCRRSWCGSETVDV